jgi:hypothetical protein
MLTIYEHSQGRPQPVQWMKDLEENKAVQWLVYEVLVDSGYPSGEDLARCEKKGVVVYAPWNENAFTEAKRADGAKEGQIPKDRFTYDCHSSPAGPNAYLRCRLSRTICLQGRSTSPTIRSAPAIRCMSALSFPFAVRSAPALHLSVLTGFYSKSMIQTVMQTRYLERQRCRARAGRLEAR